MKASVLVGFGTVALVIVAPMACATSMNDDGTRPPDAGEDVTVIPEDGAFEGDAGDEPSVDASTCSEAGWCATALPNADLVMKDIWPLPGRAFAIAESLSLGVKILEWDDAEATWKYIDDGTQNDPGLGTWAGKIWAPNENEIYYGISPGYVYYGTRSVPPATTWSWTRQRLGTSSSNDPYDGNPENWWRKWSARTPTLGVWGTSSNDVYAWFKNTIYHRSSADSGAPEWVLEHAPSDVNHPIEHLIFVGAAGTHPDNVWFSGARIQEGPPPRRRAESACALLVHKDSAGYRRVADGALSGQVTLSRPCTERPGALMIGGSEGWLTDLQAPSPYDLIGLKGARDVVRISLEGGSYSVALAPVPLTLSRDPFNSLSTVEGDLWLGGAGVVVRGAGLWDGGTYGITTISLNGTRLPLLISQVRGTSNTNLWAIGGRYAFHKTTP